MLFHFRILFKTYHSLLCLGCERIAVAFKLNLTIAKDDDEEENDGTTSNENLSSSVIVKGYDNSHPQLLSTKCYRILFHKQFHVWIRES